MIYSDDGRLLERQVFRNSYQCSQARQMVRGPATCVFWDWDAADPGPGTHRPTRPTPFGATGRPPSREAARGPAMYIGTPLVREARRGL